MIPTKKRYFTKEWKEKISKAKKGKPRLNMRGRKMSEAQKKLLSMIMTGKPGPNKGKKFSGQTRIKMSLAKKRKIIKT